MKKTLIGLCLIGLTLLPGCNGCRNDFKHFTSDTFGINRTVTLYDGNGVVIKEYHTTSKVEDQGGTLYFIDNHGKAVYISGTITVEED